MNLDDIPCPFSPGGVDLSLTERTMVISYQRYASLVVLSLNENQSFENIFFENAKNA